MIDRELRGLGKNLIGMSKEMCRFYAIIKHVMIKVGM